MFYCNGSVKTLTIIIIGSMYCNYYRENNKLVAINISIYIPLLLYIRNITISYDIM